MKQGRRHDGDQAPQPRAQLKRHYCLLAGGEAVILWIEPQLILRDRNSAEWAEFERWAATPGNIAAVAPMFPVAANSDRPEALEISRREPVRG